MIFSSVISNLYNLLTRAEGAKNVNSRVLWELKKTMQYILGT